MAGAVVIHVALSAALFIASLGSAEAQGEGPGAQCPGDCPNGDDGRLCDGGCPDSCACAQNDYCCTRWSWSCDACEAGLGNEFGCEPGVCAGAPMPSEPAPALGQPDSCACAHNRYCCIGWSSACDACEAGDGNQFGCEPGVCGEPPSWDFAKADLSPGGSGEGIVGTVTLSQSDSGVEIAYSIRGLVPGSVHGFHVHDSADFSDGCLSAGGHYNPFGRNHGAPWDPPEDRQVGSNGNIVADERGVASGVLTDPLVMLSGETSVVGRSFVLHEGEDDLGRGGQDCSLTTGCAGARLACGEIVGASAGCTPTPAQEPIVGRQCQAVNVRAMEGTEPAMVAGRESESEDVCTYVPCREEGYSYPLLVLLHGYTSNGTRQEWRHRWAPMADELGFILAIPHGTHEQGSGKRFWSATDACCNFGPGGTPTLGGSGDGLGPGRSAVDDSGYLRQLIATIRSMYKVDPRRIFVTGHSNGGYMSHRMACDHADLLAGVASLAGSTFEGTITGSYDVFGQPDYACEPTEPIHVLEIHGTADRVVTYDGGRPPRTLSAAETFESWSGLNQCGASETTSLALDMVAPAGADTDRTVAQACAKGGASELWTIRGGSHGPAFMDVANGGTTLSRMAVEWLLSRPKPVAGWAPAVSALHARETAVEAWRAALHPIAIATKFSYTQTHCSYRGDQSESLPGWTKLSLASDPEDGPCDGDGACEVIDPVSGAVRGGMHALAFVSDDGGRVIIAFRGTDLDPRQVSGRADSCSNMMRGGRDYDKLPQPRCAGFSFEQLDYITTARNFVKAVRREVGPLPDVLTTGHSLGSHLATMMAVEFGFWSVSFGSGGGEHSVVACDGMHGSCAVPRAEDCLPMANPRITERLTVINHPYDPGHYRATERGMMGWVCAWDGQVEEPDSCRACAAVHLPAACTRHHQGRVSERGGGVVLPQLLWRGGVRVGADARVRRRLRPLLRRDAHLLLLPRADQRRGAAAGLLAAPGGGALRLAGLQQHRGQRDCDERDEHLCGCASCGARSVGSGGCGGGARGSDCRWVAARAAGRVLLWPLPQEDPQGRRRLQARQLRVMNARSVQKCAFHVQPHSELGLWFLAFLAADCSLVRTRVRPPPLSCVPASAGPVPARPSAPPPPQRTAASRLPPTGTGPPTPSWPTFPGARRIASSRCPSPWT